MTAAEHSQAIQVAWVGLLTGSGAALKGLTEDGEQHAEAKKELKIAAKAAADAGHPGLAARLWRLAEDSFVGSMTDDAPTSTQVTRGDIFAVRDEDFRVRVRPPNEPPKRGDIDYPGGFIRPSEFVAWHPDQEKNLDKEDARRQAEADKAKGANGEPDDGPTQP